MITVVRLLATMLVLPLVACSSQSTNLFDSFKRIVPRGTIRPITNPTFVSADEAQIEDDSYVLGVVIDGQARAYSLNLLNRHEVVNDKIGDVAYAVVW